MKTTLFRLALVILLFTNSFILNAQTVETPKGPDLEYVCELRVKCGEAYSVGQTAHGTRVVIPIIGGTFEGPNMKGEVLSGGADYQLVDQKKGRNEVEAIYSIKTDDGVYIHVRNCGLICMSNDGGQKGFYFRTAPKFEAPNDSKYDWLNNSIFVCRPDFAPDCICLKVWRVK
ncbi:MAG: DUF3237 family protein [Prevotellaceae bacterium]|nr:DUF3237 family protein [Prevotellaceae bacterium]